ncbi:MAG TPA: enolase C-terminal domain-like protein [Candidatus Dormibacteraeota bacterium]|jgi:L-alanine-DL-glutamate epimerase-like enolase superfamily enzyme|nr:enolase C-terminal domain-like protein [Candidatus Dormibacteraeota bacterium]
MGISRVDTSVFTVPTDLPGGDGTATWDSTTIVVVELTAAEGDRGLGYTYGSAATASFVHDELAATLLGVEAAEPRRMWARMVAQVRNAGRQGVAAAAISAVDMALWDLDARRLGLPLFRRLGAARDAVNVYGSGGLTAYTAEQVVDQLLGWVESGTARVKMKIAKDRGRDPDEDLRRVAAVRRAIGGGPELFVDANGGYTTKQAVRMADRMAEHGVTYFEEPVSSDQLRELATIRTMIPMDVAAGEYGYDPWYFQAMLDARAVDILQADATRSLGVTGWLIAADLAYARGLPFSAHCAPAAHAHLGCAAPAIAHIEYFHDHARLEGMLFEGVPRPFKGSLVPDPSAPGLGLSLKRADADAYLTSARATEA